MQEVEGKKKRKKRSMQAYAPLIFEECYVKHKGLNKILRSFENEADPELSKLIDPTGGMHPGIF